jgi:hypothetical protein
VAVDKYDFRDFPISNGRLKSGMPDFGRILLDRRCRNVYKRRPGRKAIYVRAIIAKSIVLVPRRTAGGG